LPLPGESCLQNPVWLFSFSYKNKNPGFFCRDSFYFNSDSFSVLTKASRTISKIVAKIKEAGICFCDCHCGSKSKLEIETNKFIFYFF
jgi:hypothetical protein